MNPQTFVGRKDRKRFNRRALFSLLLSVVILASLTGGGMAAPSLDPTRVQSAVSNRALFAIFLTAQEQLTQARDAGLVLYSQISSSHGEILLVGADQKTIRDLSLPMRLLDNDTASADYYLAYAPVRTSVVSWADYGRLLLDLGNQVLLRTNPERVEPLLELGVKLAHIPLEQQPWPITSLTDVMDSGAGTLALTPDPNVQDMLNQVTTDTLYSYTAQLSGAQAATIAGSTYTITRRYTYSGTPIQKAGQFIAEHLQARGLAVESQTWGTSGTPSTYPNIIGQITGSTNPGDIYIIGGHLDDVPTFTTAPGADDNASGSVGTLIAAEILSQYQWSCTLRFAFWTGEEQGLYGSAAYATRAKNQGENIKGYLNMDMISYNSGEPNEINLFSKSSVPGSVDMMDLYADTISAYGINLVPVKYPDDTMGNYSDNKSFWDKGYASILAIEDYYGDETPYYHTSNDKLSTLNMTYYTDFVKASLATFVHLSGCLVTGPAPTLPSAPSNLTAAPVSGSQINLAWMDNADNETGYKIERCTGVGCSDFGQIGTVASNVTSYQNTGLAASTGYTYRVLAYNTGGNSDYSNTVSATTSPASTVPASPTNLIATSVSRSQINLNWTDNASDETGFYIERCKGTSTCTTFTRIATLSTNITSYANTGLSRNTTYTYRVRAYNAVGASAYSNTATARTPK